MTIPWMMNCAHSEEGWCLVCVVEQGNRLERAEMALRKIAQWHGEFPPATTRDGKPSAYGVEYGSNGERDYMRQVALDALRRPQRRSLTDGQ